MNNHGPDTLGPTRGTPAVGGPCYMQAASPRNSPWRFLESGKGPNGKRDAIKGKRRRSSFYQIFHEFWPWDSLKPTVHASASLTSCSSGAILCKWTPTQIKIFFLSVNKQIEISPVILYRYRTMFKGNTSDRLNWEINGLCSHFQLHTALSLDRNCSSTRWSVPPFIFRDLLFVSSLLFSF